MNDQQANGGSFVYAGFSGDFKRYCLSMFKYCVYLHSESALISIAYQNISYKGFLYQ